MHLVFCKVTTQSKGKGDTGVLYGVHTKQQSVIWWWCAESILMLFFP